MPKWGLFLIDLGGDRFFFFLKVGWCEVYSVLDTFTNTFLKIIYLFLFKIMAGSYVATM